MSADLYDAIMTNDLTQVNALLAEEKKPFPVALRSAINLNQNPNLSVGILERLADKYEFSGVDLRVLMVLGTAKDRMDIVDWAGAQGGTFSQFNLHVPLGPKGAATMRRRIEYIKTWQLDFDFAPFIEKCAAHRKELKVLEALAKGD